MSQPVRGSRQPRDCGLVVVRGPSAVRDAWDSRLAVVAIDGVDVDELRIGQKFSCRLTAGEHELAVRLLYHFGPARMIIDLQRQHTTTVTISKGSSSSLDLLNPRRYWQFSVVAEPTKRR